MDLSVVWIDFKESKVFHLSREQMVRERLFASGELEDPSLYDRTAYLLRDSKRILILGPGPAKIHLMKRLGERFPDEAKRVVGCEASDHPTDPQIAAYALKYLRKPAG